MFALGAGVRMMFGQAGSSSIRGVGDDRRKVNLLFYSKWYKALHCNILYQIRVFTLQRTLLLSADI